MKTPIKETELHSNRLYIPVFFSSNNVSSVLSQQEEQELLPENFPSDHTIMLKQPVHLKPHLQWQVSAYARKRPSPWPLLLSWHKAEN